MRAVVTRLVVVLGLVLATGACAGGGQDSGEKKGTLTADATPRPERPADERTEEGAQRFAEFAADTVLYVMATGDAPALTAISDLQTCEDCLNWNERFHRSKIDKLMVPDGPATYEPDGEQRRIGTIRQVPLTMDIPAGTSFDQETRKKLADVDAAKVSFTANVIWMANRWQLLSYTMS